MIRPFTCLCLLAACGSGLYLYAEKHRAELLDRDIAHVMRQAQAARERTGMLRAEWALLNEPGRLQDLASRYLHLQPMAPVQFVRLADLGARLPPPVAPPPAGSTDDDQDSDAAPAPAPAPAAPAPPAAPAKSAPVQVVEKPKPPHPAHLAAHDPGRARPRALADAAPLRAHGAPLALAAPQPVGAVVMSAVAHPRPSPSGTGIRAMPAFAGVPVHSAFGGTGTLPPPVPLAAGEQ